MNPLSYRYSILLININKMNLNKKTNTSYIRTYLLKFFFQIFYTKPIYVGVFHIHNEDLS